MIDTCTAPGACGRRPHHERQSHGARLKIQSMHARQRQRPLVQKRLGQPGRLRRGLRAEHVARRCQIGQALGDRDNVQTGWPVRISPTSGPDIKELRAHAKARVQDRDATLACPGGPYPCNDPVRRQNLFPVK